MAKFRNVGKKILAFAAAVSLSVSMGICNTSAAELEGYSSVVKTVAVSVDHTAAVAPNGELYTWGKNVNGEIGNGTYDYKNSPIPAHTKVLTRVVSVSANTGRTAAITKNGDLYVWGDNYFGQIGNGESGYSVISPVPVKVLSNVASVSLAQNCSAAVTKNGDLYMWGSNGSSMLGNGKSSNYNATVPEKIMSNVASVSLGNRHSAAITKNGDLYMWGSNNYGQLGDTTPSYGCDTPKKIMEDVAYVDLGYDCTAVVKKNGDLYTWGHNYSFVLGTDTVEERESCNTPVKILSGVSSVSIGMYHGAAIKTNGDLYTWGYNSMGVLANGLTTDYKAVTPEKVMSDVAYVDVSYGSTAIIKTNGDLYICGNNQYGQVGTGMVPSYGDPPYLNPTLIYLPISNEEYPEPTGDVDGSGEVDVGDVIELAKCIVNDDTAKFGDAVDFDGDGLIDVGDVIALAKMIVES